MRHVRTLGVLEQMTPNHGDVFQGGGKEVWAVGRRGGLCVCIIGLPVLWMDIRGGVAVQIPWEGLDSVRRLLSRVSLQF